MKNIEFDDVKRIFGERLKTFRGDDEGNIVLIHPNNTEYLIKDAQIIKRGSHVVLTKDDETIILFLGRYYSNKSRLISKWAQITAASSSAIVAGITITLILSYMLPDRKKDITLTELHINQMNQVKYLEETIEIMNQKIIALEATIKNISEIPVDYKVSSQMKSLNNSISNLEKSMGNLEEIILESPSKALSIPLLRKDFDNLNNGYQSELLILQREIDRVYDLNKWFLGLMLTMVLSVMGLAISIFLKGRETDYSLNG